MRPPPRPPLSRRLNQKYSEVVREAESYRAAVEAAAPGSEQRRRSLAALWRLGAGKWRLLEAWKAARRNLHADLGDLRARVAEYAARAERQGGAGGAGGGGREEGQEAQG